MGELLSLEYKKVFFPHQPCSDIYALQAVSFLDWQRGQRDMNSSLWLTDDGRLAPTTLNYVGDLYAFLCQFDFLERQQAIA